MHRPQRFYSLREVERAIQDGDDDPELTEFRDQLAAYVGLDATLIHEDNLVDYVKGRSGFTSEKFLQWPYNHIDWEAAANEFIRFDFHAVTYEGDTYYVDL